MIAWITCNRITPTGITLAICGLCNTCSNRCFTVICITCIGFTCTCAALGHCTGYRGRAVYVSCCTVAITYAVGLRTTYIVRAQRESAYAATRYATVCAPAASWVLAGYTVTCSCGIAGTTCCPLCRQCCIPACIICIRTAGIWVIAAPTAEIIAPAYKCAG